MLIDASASEIESSEYDSCKHTKQDVNVSSKKHAIAGTHVTRLDEAERVVDTERREHADIPGGHLCVVQHSVERQ